MEITVRYFTILRRITMKRQENLKMKEHSTLEDMLAVITEKYGRKFERYAASGISKEGLRIVFLLNGKEVTQFKGLKTRLHEGDTVVLMPPIAGG